jgi:hypothetical protein
MQLLFDAGHRVVVTGLASPKFSWQSLSKDNAPSARHVYEFGRRYCGKPQPTGVLATPLAPVAFHPRSASAGVSKQVVEDKVFNHEYVTMVDEAFCVLDGELHWALGNTQSTNDVHDVSLAQSDSACLRGFSTCKL